MGREHSIRPHFFYLQVVKYRIICYNVCMSKTNKNNKNSWSESDKQAFADRNILKAQTVQARRYQGPMADEWDDVWDEVYS